jgi:hypothetical protein
MADHHNELDLLRRKLHESAALPAGDPQRQAIESQLADAGDALSEEWAALGREEAVLRRALAGGIEPPAGLSERLRRIPDEPTTGAQLRLHSSSAPAAISRRRWLYWTGAAAAVLMVFALGAIVGRELGNGGKHAEPLAEFARLAADRHATTTYTEFAGSDPVDVQRRLRALAAQDSRIRFAVDIPRLPAGYELTGARRCMIGDERVVCTMWERNGITYSLFQFDQARHDLSAKIHRRAVSNDDCTVIIWTDADGHAYALVAKGLPPQEVDEALRTF